MIIRGNIVGVTTPASDWNQRSADKADYIHGREILEQAMEGAKRHEENKGNPHAVTAQQIGAAEAAHTHTPEQAGTLSEAGIRALIQQELGVIEHGTY